MKTLIYWIDGRWPGRLAIMPRPRGGDWLEDEVRDWRKAGIDVVVSALTGEEVMDFELAEEEQVAGTLGLKYLSFAIPDRGLPGSVEQIQELARKIESALAGGKNVAIHCRQGIGRSSIIAASILVASGMEPGEAFARIETAAVARCQIRPNKENGSSTSPNVCVRLPRFSFKNCHQKIALHA